MTVTQPIVITCFNSGGEPWGVCGNYCKLFWKGASGGNVLTYRGNTQVGGNRGLVVEKLAIFGNGFNGAAAGDCLRLEAEGGDPGALYKFTMRDVFTHYGTRGVYLRGAVFEGYCENIHAENNLSHGFDMDHTNVSASNRGIVSNIYIVHPNLSRNFGAGLRCANSTTVTHGSFVLNAVAGILAPSGIRHCAFNNGENTGEAFIKMGGNDYGSYIFGNEASSDGNTHARRFVGGQWQSVGKPMLYCIDMTGVALPALEQWNKTSYYGTATTSPMRTVR